MKLHVFGAIIQFLCISNMFSKLLFYLESQIQVCIRNL